MNDTYLGWMTVDGGGRRKSGKACESVRVFGDVAQDVEVLGIWCLTLDSYLTLQHPVQYHQTL